MLIGSPLRKVVNRPSHLDRFVPKLLLSAQRRSCCCFAFLLKSFKFCPNNALLCSLKPAIGADPGGGSGCSI